MPPILTRWLWYLYIEIYVFSVLKATHSMNNLMNDVLFETYFVTFVHSLKYWNYLGLIKNYFVPLFQIRFVVYIHNSFEIFILPRLDFIALNRDFDEFLNLLQMSYIFYSSL